MSKRWNYRTSPDRMAKTQALKDARPMTKEERAEMEHYDHEAATRAASWFCDPCKVEVYNRRCPHCGKLERDAR